MRKIVFAVGLIVLVAGIVLAAVSALESYGEVEELGSWTPILTMDPANPTQLSPLAEPYNTTFWGYGPMPFNSWLELNIATSGPVRVRVSIVIQQEELNSVFDEVGSLFVETVPAGGGTYQVSIVNEGTVPVQILSGSNVVAKHNVTQSRSVFPYVTWGSLIAVVGVVVLVVGFVAKPRKKLSGSKKQLAKR